MKKILALLLSALGFFTACDGPELMYGPVPPDHWTTPGDTMSEMYGVVYKTFEPGKQIDAIPQTEGVSSEELPYTDDSQ